MLTKSEPVSFEELHVLMITQEELLKSSQENSKENSIMAMAANKGNLTHFNNSARGGFNNRGRGGFNGRGRSNNRGNFSSRGGSNQGHHQGIQGYIPQPFPQSNPTFPQSNPNFSNPNSNFSNHNPTAPPVKYVTNKVIRPLIATTA